MIQRDMAAELRSAAREYPVVTVFGPRQSGKTTLVQMVFPRKPYRSLEEPDLRRAASMDPRGFLADLAHGAILDEIQRAPQLLSFVQGIVDRAPNPGSFILTGSHQPALHEAVSQSLAGRTAVLTLLPFSLDELRKYGKQWDAFDLLVHGTFPRLHDQGLEPRRFFNAYLRTYVERDVRALINLKDLNRFQQFLTLLAGRVGQIVNYTSLASDVGVSSTTIREWVSVLEASYILFILPPYFENLRKRVIKSPKVYFADAGLAAHLLSVTSPAQAARDPLRGGLYENLIIVELLKARLNRGLRPEMFFYRDTHGNEVDLVIRRGGRLVPVEIKSASTFTGEFLTGIERFRAVVGEERCEPGTVLYNGEQAMKVKGVRILNPLRHPEIHRIAIESP